MNIPACVHFCWIGKRLPWAYAFAVLSAAEQGGMDAVVLHHTDELEDGPVLRALQQAPGVRLEHTNPLACLTRAQALLGLGEGLTSLYTRLTSPVMRADVLRAAILYLQGGIYLDMDTVTVASLRPLLGVPQFVGSEFIVWPHAVRTSRSPFVWARHLALDLMRKAMRLLPGGWQAFRRVEGWYFPGVNNAVMGAAPGRPCSRRICGPCLRCRGNARLSPTLWGLTCYRRLSAITRQRNLPSIRPRFSTRWRRRSRSTGSGPAAAPGWSRCCRRKPW